MVKNVVNRLNFVGSDGLGIVSSYFMCPFVEYSEALPYELFSLCKAFEASMKLFMVA